MLLARMITLAKWKDQEDLSAGEVSADAVTADLRTRSNSLSFWKCSDDTQISDAILALASARDRLDKIEVVWVKSEDLQTVTDQLTPTKGKTPVADLIDKHVDVYSLDYTRLGAVANVIKAALSEMQFSKLSKKEVKELIAKALSNDRLRAEDLRPRLKAAVAT